MTICSHIYDCICDSRCICIILDSSMVTFAYSVTSMWDIMYTDTTCVLYLLCVCRKHPVFLICKSYKLALGISPDSE